MKRKREKSGIFKEREKLQRKEKGLRDQKGEGEEEDLNIEYSGDCMLECWSFLCFKI